MKRTILILVLVMAAMAGQTLAQGGRPNIFAPPPTASGPVADFVNSIVAAFNKHDTAFFQKVVAPDAVWLDEDGHHMIATVWVNRILAATPPRMLSITNLRVGGWGDTGWAGFNYVMQGTNMVKGTNSILLKKTGNDWQVVLIHGAVDTAIVAH